MLATTNANDNLTTSWKIVGNFICSSVCVADNTPLKIARIYLSVCMGNDALTSSGMKMPLYRQIRSVRWVAWLSLRCFLYSPRQPSFASVIHPAISFCARRKPAVVTFACIYWFEEFTSKKYQIKNPYIYRWQYQIWRLSTTLYAQKPKTEIKMKQLKQTLERYLVIWFARRLEYWILERRGSRTNFEQQAHLCLGARWILNSLLLFFSLVCFPKDIISHSMPIDCIDWWPLEAILSLRYVCWFFGGILYRWIGNIPY